MILPNTGFPGAVGPPVRARVDRPLAGLSPDHPLRRMVERGARDLSLRELVGLLVDDGRDVDQALQRGVAVCSAATNAEGAPSLRAMGTLTPSALAGRAGVSIRAAARLLAAFELGRRAIEEARPVPMVIAVARDAYDYLHLRMRDLRQEEFHVLLLDRQYALLGDVTVSVGLVDTVIVHAREVFRAAIDAAASHVVLVHNHPSGESAPSPEDVRITEQLIAAGTLLGIPVLDHVIVGEGRYYSFAEHSEAHRRLLAA